jgi:hypothetical protein
MAARHIKICLYVQDAPRRDRQTAASLTAGSPASQRSATLAIITV